MQENINNFTKEKFTNILSNLFLVCLGVLAFQSIFGQAIFGFDLSNYNFGKNILNILDSIKYGLVIFAIICGTLLFYANRDKIESIEEEQKKEIEEEEKRGSEFVENFPVISRIPVFGWVVKWMYSLIFNGKYI